MVVPFHRERYTGWFWYTVELYVVEVELTLTWEAFHSSKLVDRTKEICTPKLRWIPEHRIQIKVPKFAEAHRGPIYMIKEAR